MPRRARQEGANVNIIQRKIMIDPGHGGSDPGNVNFGLRESDTTLAIATRLGHYIRLYSRDSTTNTPIITPHFTRVGDTTVGINERAWMARNKKCELMLSIHTDSTINPLALGATAFVSARDTNKERSTAFGAAILAQLNRLGIKSRGVRPDSQTNVKSLGVLRDTCSAMPAVLIECGFASNLHDRNILKDAVGREMIAMAIARAVVGNFGIALPFI